MRTCVAVLLLVLGLALWPGRVRSRHAEARSSRRPGIADYVAIGVGVLAVECAFVFLLTVTPPRAEELAVSMAEYVHPEASGGESPAGEVDEDAAAVTGNWLWDRSGRRRLPKRLSATPTNKPEVFLRPIDEESAQLLRASSPYLRAFALEHYVEDYWAVGDSAANRRLQAEEGEIRFPSPPERPGPSLSVRVFHPVNANGENLFVALQGVTSTDLPELRRVAPDIHELPAPPSPSGYDYQATSTPVTLAHLMAGNDRPVVIPDREAAPHLLELPENSALRDSILQIAARTQGSLDQRLLALDRFLEANCTYSLTVENPRNLDPLENFLFHERRGHCEYFATAGALLCRSLGIPARVAFGWSGGRHYPGSNLFLFRAREAHAWTEILIEDVGWVVFDVTPAGARGAAESSTAPSDEEPPFQDPEDPFDMLAEEDSFLATRTAWILWAALGLGVLTLVLLHLRPGRAGAGESSVTGGLLPDPPGYLAGFRRMSARLGHPMPTGRTLRQHLEALRKADLSPDFADELLEYHYALTYGNASSDRSRERALTKAIKSWRG